MQSSKAVHRVLELFYALEEGALKLTRVLMDLGFRPPHLVHVGQVYRAVELAEELVKDEDDLRGGHGGGQLREAYIEGKLM
jgi:hypothetical protein